LNTAQAETEVIKKQPKLKPINEYLDVKFERDYMGILQRGLQEREQYYLTGDDQELAQSIRERI